jgi:uncharacterized protein (DUF305 family)
MTTDTTPTDDLDSPPEMRLGGGVRRFGLVALAVALVLGMLIGVGGTILVHRLRTPGDGSVEAGFARDMSTHHAQAVEMAILAHEKGNDPEVRQVGADIALTQQAQIGMMQTWLREWNLSPTGTQPRMAWMPDGAAAVKDGLMPGMATDSERAQLRASSGKDFDALFLRLMINHHIGGIHMAQTAVREARNSDVKWLAQTMADSQQREITDLRTLQTRLGVS